MDLFKTNYITYSLLLLKLLNDITSASVSNPEIVVNENKSRVETISDEKNFIQRYKNNNISEPNKTGFYRPWLEYPDRSALMKTYPNVSSTATEEISAKRLNIFDYEPQGLTKKYELYKSNESREDAIGTQQINSSQTNKTNSSERTETVIHRSKNSFLNSPHSVDNNSYIVCEDSHGNFRYAMIKPFHNTIPNVSEDRNIKHTIIESNWTHEESFNQNPSSSVQGMKLENEMVSEENTYMSVFSQNNNFFTPKDTKKGLQKNSDAALVNTRHNKNVDVPIIVSDAENIPNYHIPSNYKIVPVEKDSTLPQNIECMRIKELKFYEKKYYTEVKCLNLKRNKYEYIIVAKTKKKNINEIWAFKRPSYILYDTPYLINKQNGRVCRYLFRLNEYIVFCKAKRIQGEKFRSLILKFDGDTNTIKSAKYMATQHQSVKNFLKSNTFCYKFYYKVPIFVSLNFTTPFNLESFTLAVTKSDYGIIYTVGVLISFSGGIKPNIGGKEFMLGSRTTDKYIFNFILSCKFPLYSFEKTLSGNRRLYFDPKYTSKVGDSKKSMKIKKFIEHLENQCFGPKKRAILSHFKENRKLKEPNGLPVPVEKDIAIKLIHDDCVLIKTNLDAINELIINTRKLNKKERLEIRELISNILQNLDLSWCIKYQDNTALLENECNLISFYLFFYNEVRYVLEYWLSLD